MTYEFFQFRLTPLLAFRYTSRLQESLRGSDCQSIRAAEGQGISRQGWRSATSPHKCQEGPPVYQLPQSNLRQRYIEQIAISLNSPFVSEVWISEFSEMLRRALERELIARQETASYPVRQLRVIL